MNKIHRIVSIKKSNTKPLCLFMAHRTPFPPDKGERIRAYNVLRALSKKYAIHLVTTLDRSSSPDELKALENFCQIIYAVDIRGRSVKYSAIRSLIKREPVTFSYFYQGKLAREIRKMTRKTKYDLLYISSSGMIPYFRYVDKRPNKVIMDFVDVDSFKYKNMSNSGTLLERLMYKRESSLLEESEVKIAKKMDINLFVTEQEKEIFSCIFKNKYPRISTSHIRNLENGVDFDYWSKGADMPSPYEGRHESVIIFLGTMDYAPNAAAVCYFANRILPYIIQNIGHTSFFIVGDSPSKNVIDLGVQYPDYIHITGYVKDTRPWLAHADVLIAPINIASGIQNKILEAMAAGTAIVASPEATEGLRFKDTSRNYMPCVISRTPNAFASAVSCLIKNSHIRNEIASQAQQMVKDSYSWKDREKQLMELIKDMK